MTEKLVQNFITTRIRNCLPEYRESVMAIQEVANSYRAMIKSMTSPAFYELAKHPKWRNLVSINKKDFINVLDTDAQSLLYQIPPGKLPAEFNLTPGLVILKSVSNYYYRFTAFYKVLRIEANDLPRITFDDDPIQNLTAQEIIGYCERTNDYSKLQLYVISLLRAETCLRNCQSRLWQIERDLKNVVGITKERLVKLSKL